MSNAGTDLRKPGSKPLYVNHTTMTKKTLKEVMKLNWRAGAGWMRVVLLVLAAFGLVFAAVQFITFGLMAIGQVLSMLLLGGMSLFLAQRGYALRAPGYVRLQLQTWGEDSLDKTVSLYPEEIMQDSRLGQLHFGYSQLRRVLVGKNILILKLEDGGLILDRFGFQDAEEQEVLAFLAEMTPPPPLKKKLRERLAEARAKTEAARATQPQAPADPQIAALLGDEDEQAGKGKDGSFDITDDSWVDEMDAEEAARKGGDGED